MLSQQPQLYSTLVLNCFGLPCNRFKNIGVMKKGYLAAFERGLLIGNAKMNFHIHSLAVKAFRISIM